MMTYSLFKTQSMLLSATSKKGLLDDDLQAVQAPEHALVSTTDRKPPDGNLQAAQTPEHPFVNYKQKMPTRWGLTACSKPTTFSCQKQ